MRIAIVLMRYNPFGGYERQAAILAEALYKRGHEVTVLASEWPESAEAAPTRRPEEETGRIKFEKVPILGWSSWLKVLSFAFFSKRRLDQEAFDSVIAFDRTLKMDIYRAGNACHREWMAFRRKNGGAPDRISMAINPLHAVINGIERRLFGGILKNNGKIVVLSRIGAEQIRKHYGVDEGRFAVIPPVVDLKRFDAASLPRWRKETRAALGAGDDATLLLHVGSGFRIKGLKNTVEALSHLSKKGFKASLAVAGSDRRETKNLSNLASGLGVGKNVRFLGGVKDIERYYAASDIFVVPSLFETFGVAAMEALSFGLPVIVGRGAGVSYMIEEENAGRVIETPADPERLAGMIIETAEEENRLRSSGLLGAEREKRRRVASKCSRDEVAEKFLAVIRQMKPI